MTYEMASTRPNRRWPETFLLLGALLLATANASAADGDGQAVVIPWGPYLQNLTPTRVTLLWTANAPNEGVVEYGESKDKLDRRLTATAHDPQDAHQQEVTITGLDPDTTYYYRVTSTPNDGLAPVSSETESFHMPPAQSTSYTFAVIADTHQSKHAPALAARLLDEQPHFILHAGDYNPTMGGLLRPYRQVLQRIPIYFARGNHDPVEKQQQFAAMPGPGNELYYSFRWSNALFLSVDANDHKGLSQGGQQYRWLESELQNSSDTWKFVFQHFPVYSAWGGGMDARLDDERRLLERYGVDVVFQGHMHNYDRSYPLRDQKVVSRDRGGVTYITASGACGGGETFPHPHRPWFIAKQWRGQPFLGLCTVNDKQLVIQFVTAEGLLFDILELKAR